jgi:TPR repeat protein
VTEPVDSVWSEPGGARAWAVALACVSALGAILRALHLDLPMRYDESVTYLAYAAHGWEYAVSSYQNPNNHVLHTVLVSWSVALFGNHPWAIRLPALLAGIALIPATAWAGRRLHGRTAGLAAATLVAVSPVLIEFSTNARGYTLVALLVVLALVVGSHLVSDVRLRWLWWMAWVEIGVLGMFTVPVMAIPWLGLTAWLAHGLWRATALGTSVSMARRLAPLAASTAVVGLVLGVFYSGIVVNEGLDALTANRFVAPESPGKFLSGLPADMLAILAHWGGGVPLVIGLVVASLALAGVASRGAPKEWRALCIALVAGASLSLVATRNLGEPRIWLWALPVLAVAAGIGAAEIGARMYAGRGVYAALAATGVCALVTTANVVVAEPVRASRETGVLPELTQIYEAVRDEYRTGDAVIGDFVGAEPLRYYLERQAASSVVPARSAVERAWVLVDPRDTARVARARSQLASVGAPPLEESTPFTTIGAVSVYLIARPTAAQDPRIAEAVAWHTGTAGTVDDGRARQLLEQVAAETGDPVARVWLARCAAIGCMGSSGGRALDAAERDALAEVAELALAGFPEAAYLVGASLDEGWSGTVDPLTAAAWYEQAAAAGHGLAARHLGDALAAGRGVARDDALARIWWQRAADAGDPAARERLDRSR